MAYDISQSSRSPVAAHRETVGAHRETNDAPPSSHVLRLLQTMAQPGASIGRTDLRENFVVVAITRRSLTSVALNAPRAVADIAVARGWARWSCDHHLEITNEGRMQALVGGKTSDAPSPLTASSGRQRKGQIVKPRQRRASDAFGYLSQRRGRAGRAFLDPAEIMAGERYRRDVTQAAVLPNVTTNWNFDAREVSQNAPQEQTVNDFILAARKRVSRANDFVGSEFSGLLLDVCGFEKGLELIEREREWPPRSAKVAIKLALGRLAEHYALKSEATGPARAPMRVWSAPDEPPETKTPLQDS